MIRSWYVFSFCKAIIAAHRILAMKHYREQVAGYEKLLNTVRNLREEIKKSESESGRSGAALDLSLYKKQFFEAMNDDFNTPLALGVLFDLSRETNQFINAEHKLSIETLKQIDQLFNELGGKVLGIIPEHIHSAIGDAKTEFNLMNLIINIRSEVRKQKLWALSDIIRDGLNKFGFIIEDKKDGTTWWKME